MIRRKFVAMFLITGITLSMGGCATLSFTGSITCTSGKGCTEKVGVSTKGYTCFFEKSCRKEGGMFDDIAARVGTWTENLLGIHEAMAASTGFDATQVRVDLSTTNVAITNSTGNFIVSLYNGQTLAAQREFAYYRSGNSLYATDPGSVNAWVSSVTAAYDSVQISNANNDLTYSPTTTADTTATITSATVYQGSTVESHSTSFPINNNGTCNIGVNCKQF